MLYAGNPYVLPSTIAGAIAYLGATILTEASLLVRLGVLVGIVGVVPIVLNRVRGVLAESTASDGAESVEEAEAGEESVEEAEAGEESVEEAEAGEGAPEAVDAKPDRSGS